MMMKRSVLVLKSSTRFIIKIYLCKEFTLGMSLELLGNESVCLISAFQGKLSYDIMFII